MAVPAPLLLSLALSLLLLLPQGSAAEDQIRSLLEFKKGIKSDPSNKVSVTWIFPSDASACPSGFYGVVCDASASSVIAIALDRLGLVGELKLNTIAPLKSLQNLTLAGNFLSGRLVPALGSMSSLQVIDLSGNQFYGPIPSRLTGMWALHYLDLSGNKFSGGIPRGIGNLQQLKVLDLHSNQLQGDVRELIPELRNVKRLDLSDNNFSGTIELSVEKVSSLANTVEYVNISGNDLGGGFWGMDVMKLFRNLKYLDLSGNGIAGKLQDFGQLPNLQVLRLGRNRLSGPLPEGLLQGEVHLVELDLSGNQFSGSISNINSTYLSTLNISSNSISGPLPPTIGNCRIVDLSRNQISDDISVLATWNTDLEVLDLGSNNLTGIIPNLTEFQSLTWLSLGNNHLEGNLPPTLGSSPKLSSVDLSCNKLNGRIPLSFFTSMTLTNLNFSGNLLTGAIPLEARAGELLLLSSGPSMESLDLSHNLLTGGLPPATGNWGRLKLLNLAHNNLSGQLPNELSKLSGLEYLNLSYNSFSGKVPNNLPSSLKSLDVSYNKLSGKIPKNLDGFPDLLFSGNNLEPRQASASSNQVPDRIGNLRNHHSSKSSVTVAIILASVGAAAMIVFIIIAYRRAHFHDFHIGRGVCGETGSRDIKPGRFSRPSFFRFQGSSEPPQTSLSFSNDHLLTSDSRSLSRQMDSSTEFRRNESPEGVATEFTRHVSPDGVATEFPRNALPEGVVTGAASKNTLQEDNWAATTSGRKSSPESPVLSSPQFQDTLEPVTRDVNSPDRLVGELVLLDNSPAFTAEELSRAPAEVLGRSSHGTLYKATINNVMMLCVKWLRVGLVKHKKDFVREVKKLGSLGHQNIVPLRAYYWGPREQERLILSDYIVGDSLALHLYETTPRRYAPLSFSQRLKVAREVAQGLMFLHDRGLPHGNLKPTNILLTGPENSVRLTEYALHRLMTSAGTAEQILNMGALGYRAPELVNASKSLPSLKADVYAFGVILMELLTRRSAGDIISGQSGAVDLTDWVRLCDREGRRMDCIDRDIAGGEEYSEVMDDALALSLRCILPVNERPNMRQVLQEVSSIGM